MKCVNAFALHISLVLIFVMSEVTAGEAGQLPTLPQLDSTWVLQADPQREAAQRHIPYRWCIFKNRETGDLLSFATLANDADADLELEKYSDTALEIFPDGNAVWTMPAKKTRLGSLFVRVDRARTLPVVESVVLNYCFISESSGRDNLMAQGQAWIQDDTVVFVQHTSSVPITADLVRETSRDYIRHRERSSHAVRQ